jgi:hypothetical protein
VILSDAIVNKVEPMQIRISVLNPADLLRNSLSKPTIPPTNKESASLISISEFGSDITGSIGVIN